jgi:hypothetical protein
MKHYLILLINLFAILQIQPKISSHDSILSSLSIPMITLHSVYIGYIAYKLQKKENCKKRLVYIDNDELQNYFNTRRNTTLIGIERCTQGYLYRVKNKCFNWSKFLIISSLPALAYGFALVIKP